MKSFLIEKSVRQCSSKSFLIFRDSTYVSFYNKLVSYKSRVYDRIKRISFQFNKGISVNNNLHYLKTYK